MIETAARGAQFLLAIGVAYLVALWFAIVAWTFRDIESRSRSVFTQVFSTLLVVLFFVPGLLLYLILRPKETLDQAFQRALEEEYLLQDLDELPLCPGCHRTVELEFVLCPYCQTKLREPCPSCSRLIDLRWAVCPYCAVPVGEGERVAMGVPSMPDHVLDEVRGGRRRRAIAAAAQRVGMEPDELDAISTALSDRSERAAVSAGTVASRDEEATQVSRIAASVRARLGQLLPGEEPTARDASPPVPAATGLGAEPGREGGFWADPIPGAERSRDGNSGKSN